MKRPGKELHKRPGLLSTTVILLVALLAVHSEPVLTSHAQTRAAARHKEISETFGKLEYVHHITRKDLGGVTAVETSPDGRNAYAAAYWTHALTVFKRDSKTGCIEHIQTISDTISDSGKMRRVIAVRVSPSGRYVVCVTLRSDAVNLLERDQSTGTLKVLDSVKNGENGVQNLGFLKDAAFSQDSRFVYVPAAGSAALTVFRITDDGKLAFVECTKGEDRCFSGTQGIAVDPKDKYLYVVGATLAVLERNAETGKTKLRQVIKDEQGGVHGLGCAQAVACSPDGQFVYTSAGRFGGDKADNAVCVFKKMSDGTLSLVQEIFNGQKGLVGFVGGNELQVSPDGQNLYATGSLSNSVVAFKRDVETGKLAYLQTFYNGDVASKDGMACGIGISPDGEYVYVVGEGDYSILIFKRLTGTKK